MGFEAKLTFHGAARGVTGSCYLLEVNGVRLLIDCGFYQERDLRDRNWIPFPFGAETIDAVLLTHAHLDHCGLLPKLRKEGFEGTVHCTQATGEIAQIVMLDSAKIQLEDAAFKQRRHKEEGRVSPHGYDPLYTTEDVEGLIPHFKTTRYDTEVEIANGVKASFHDAGHILGSSMIKFTLSNGGETRTVIFSGDIGRWNTPILNDPTCFEHADYVLCESTYGSRPHKPNEEIPDRLANAINETRQRGGNVVIPSFAIERTQELLYHLHGLLNEKRIPHLSTFVDSPMAIKVTEVFRKHPELFDDEMRALLEQGQHPCDLPNLIMSKTVDQSKAINHIHGTAIIIAGSGMCTGGRIKHHLKNNISCPESTILFVGYQANGTLGRILLEGAERIRIHGQHYDVRAQIRKINGFSAHAGRNELKKWISAYKEAPRKIFVTHGEESSAESFCELINNEIGYPAVVANWQETVTLD
jgi:metallo-beta-lactamase family protein